MSEQILYILLGVVGGGIVAWYLSRKQRQDEHEPIQEQFVALQRLVADQMDRIHTSMDRRLQENVRALDESKTFLANRVSAAEHSVRSVSAGLGKLAQATSALQRTSEEITAFQQMLKSPKVRGSFGEVLLANLLGEIMPHDRYELQHIFRGSGEIADAIIRLQDGYIVAIDAKFPFAHYEAYTNEQDEGRKRQLRSAFVRDVKKHITDISKKYISPQEHTLDYAFMYIPIEGVYYEAVVRDEEGDDIWEYCIVHKIIPVSPNSFLAYLHTVLVGLRGMKVQQQAKEILEHLGQLRRDFAKFGSDFTMVGTHLANAKNRYDDSARRLDKFSNRLDQLETGPEVAQLPQVAEKERVT